MTTALAALGAGALGALEWRRLARRHPDLVLENALTRARHLIAVAPITLSLLGIQVLVITRPDVAWSMPVWVELHLADLVLGAVIACISFLFGLAAHGAFATRHRQRAAALVSAVMVIGIVLGIEWDFTAPIAADLHERTSGEVVLQSSGASCAAASAANLARRYGITRTEPQMAALLGTTRFGTSPAQLVHGLAQLGLSCRKTRRPDADPAALRAPAVLFLPPSGENAGHAVLFAGMEGNGVVIIDPLMGNVVSSRAELAARWKGHAVECEARTSSGP